VYGEGKGEEHPASKSKWAIRLFASLREVGKRPYGSSLRSEKSEWA